MTNAEITALVDAEEFEARRHRTAEKPLWLRNEWDWVTSILVFAGGLAAIWAITWLIAALMAAAFADPSWRV